MSLSAKEDFTRWRSYDSKYILKKTVKVENYRGSVLFELSPEKFSSS